MYAVVRGDLRMPPGKLAAQAGHAFTDALFRAMSEAPSAAARYRDGPNAGSKAVLVAKGEDALRNLADRCLAAGVPCSLVVDSGHVLPPYFDGSPVVTALGVGPLERAAARPLLGRLKCA